MVNLKKGINLKSLSEKSMKETRAGKFIYGGCSCNCDIQSDTGYTCFDIQWALPWE